MGNRELGVRTVLSERLIWVPSVPLYTCSRLIK